MTEPADHPSERDTSDVEKKIEPGAESSKGEPAKAASDGTGGTALATAGASPVNPFLHAAAEQATAPDAAPPPRSFTSRMLDYSAHAAIIVGLIGFAWSVGDHVVNHPATSAKGNAAPLAAATPSNADPAAAKTVAEAKPAPKQDELAELRQSSQKMHDEIRALRSSIESLRNVVRRDTTPEQVRVLSAGLDGMKGNLGAMRSETSSAIAQLNTKVDKLQPGKLRELTERMARLEHPATDTTATASIPHADPERTFKAAPKPPAKPASLASAPDTHATTPDDKPQPIAGWVVRDVYQGVALVENKRGGTMEVVPGVTIPGAGVVKSIDRHGSSWTVTTSKGQFASASAPPAAQRPAPRSYERGYGYGYGYGPGAYRYGY